MSIYTYNISKNLCEILGTEFHEMPELSDQELNNIPLSEFNMRISNKFGFTIGNQLRHGLSPWNKGGKFPNKIPGNLRAYLNGINTRFKCGAIPKNKGMVLSEETKEKISKTLTGRKNPEHSIRMMGKKCHTKPHSDKVKQVLSQKSSMYCWITDGNSTIRILKTDEIPFGWKRGRTL